MGGEGRPAHHAGCTCLAFFDIVLVVLHLTGHGLRGGQWERDLILQAGIAWRLCRLSKTGFCGTFWCGRTSLQPYPLSPRPRWADSRHLGSRENARG